MKHPTHDSTIDLRAWIRDVPDFPKAGIVFKDITPLLADPRALAECVRRLAESTPRPDAVVAIESRGFLFGVALALHWEVPFVPARKFGKLPGRTVRQIYSLEYGEDSLEIHSDAFLPGTRVVIVDDLLATGGTAAATADLVQQLGGSVQAFLFVVELAGLGGRGKLPGTQVFSLVEYPLP